MPYPIMRTVLFLLLFCAGIILSHPAEAAKSAVILIYHRFGEDAYPTTNIRLEQFEAHLAELQNGKYHVLPLADIVEALKEGRELPDRSVAITIDDGYLSIYTEAWPRLKRAGFPFTVFITTDPADGHYKDMMSWDQMREMAQSGVAFGAHTASHLHMIDASPEKNRKDIERSHARYKEELGFVPEIFAYPFGEVSNKVRQLVVDSGYKAALGQFSGVAHAASDMFSIPRFALNEHFGNIDRFRRLANALPLPIHDVLPEDSVVATDTPVIGFTIDESVGPLESLSCFSPTGNKMDMERLGKFRVELRLDHPLDYGRSRINCTAQDQDGRWRWAGIFLYRPKSITP